MRAESQGLGKFSSICALLKITSKRGHVKIFNSLHNCIGTLRLLITETISKGIFPYSNRDCDPEIVIMADSADQLQ